MTPRPALVFVFGTAAALAASGVAAATGAEVYRKNCASCHGADGKGNANMVKALKAELAALDLTDAATQGESDVDLIGDTSNGTGKMPAYGKKLAAADLVAVIAHVRTLKAGATAPAGGAAPAAWTKSCKSCHGEDGKGNPKMGKALKVDAAALDMTDAATQDKADADLAKIIADGSSTNKKMAAYRKKLKADEIAALVAHLRSLAPAK